MITVTNKSKNPNLQVSINHWAKDGSTDYFTIPMEKSETWDRSDDRGFVMAVQLPPNRKSYLVVFNSVVEVFDKAGVIDGQHHSF